MTAGLEQAAAELVHFCASIPDPIFFLRPGDKWSPAQQVKHLVTSTKAATLAYTLPKWVLRWRVGKPNRPSRTFEELVARYKVKLEQGGRAGGAFIPDPVPAGYGKDKLLGEFSAAMGKMSRALQKKWKEPQPDAYIAPHPLLGKITLRELVYFTIYHTGHHLAGIRKGLPA